MLNIAGIAVDILFLLAFEAKKDRNEKPDTNADYFSVLMLLRNNRSKNVSAKYSWLQNRLSHPHQFL